jgi:hypothetical protein
VLSLAAMGTPGQAVSTSKDSIFRFQQPPRKAPAAAKEHRSEWPA